MMRQTVDVSGNLPAVLSDRTLVIANRDDAESEQVAAEYRRLRKQARLLALPLGKSGLRHLGSSDEYFERIEIPFTHWLETQKGWQPDYIVLSRNVPLGVPQTGGGFASIDSVLAMGPRRTAATSTGPRVPTALGRMALNPYFARRTGDGRFSRRTYGMYLVARLEAPTLQETLGLIERSRMARPFSDPFLLRPTNHGEPAYRAYNKLMYDAEEALTKKRVTLQVLLNDWNRNQPGPEGTYMGLCTWGYGYGPQREKDNPLELKRFVFRPGAVGLTVDSFSARLQGWRNPREPGQGTLAGMIAAGLTVASGTIDEPFLTGACRPMPLLRLYTQGYTAGEAFWASIPLLSWRNIVVGDPLCAPFARGYTQAN